MIKRNEKGFLLVETLLVAVFIASTLIFVYIQFDKVRKSYEDSFHYNTITGIYANSVVLEYLQQNGISNLSSAVSGTTTYVDITNCPGAYLENTSYCNQIMQDLGIHKMYFILNDIELFKESMKNSSNTNQFKRFLETIDSGNNIGYRLITEFNDRTYATTLARSKSGSLSR